MNENASRPHRCCGEHTRAELMRRSVAEAGKGLPAIEPGMPSPAGTGLSRRSFLLRSGGLALSVYGASLIKPAAFNEGIAKAAASDGRVLVSVFLDGGVDSLSLLAPVLDPRYQELQAAVTSGGEHDFDVGMHSTDSVDLGFVFSGEVTLIQGDGSEATLKPGDVMVQNGAKHAWENRSSEPCMICFVVLGADRTSAQA